MLRESHLLATTALRASAARSGSMGDVIDIMYRSKPPKKILRVVIIKSKENMVQFQKDNQL